MRASDDGMRGVAGRIAVVMAIAAAFGVGCASPTDLAANCVRFEDRHAFDGARMHRAVVVAVEDPAIAGVSVGATSAPVRARFIATEDAIGLYDEAGEARLSFQVVAWVRAHPSDGATRCWVPDVAGSIEVDPTDGAWTDAPALRVDESLDLLGANALPLDSALRIEAIPFWFDEDDLDSATPPATYESGRLLSALVDYAVTDPSCGRPSGDCTTTIRVRHELPLD